MPETSTEMLVRDQQTLNESDYLTFSAEFLLLREGMCRTGWATPMAAGDGLLLHDLQTIPCPASELRQYVTAAERRERDEQTQADFDASAGRMEWLGWLIVGIIILAVAVKAIRKGRTP